jgi:hypothetical protein
LPDILLLLDGADWLKRPRSHHAGVRDSPHALDPSQRRRLRRPVNATIYMGNRCARAGSVVESAIGGGNYRTLKKASPPPVIRQRR